ncbi:MAG: hypothetical protein R3301_08990 [Saprospiraceae bacterium]|nr:hypothetical protein [Saprospiraceae bacterium]
MYRFAGICCALFILVAAACRGDNRREVFELNYILDFTIQAGLNTIETHFIVNPAITSLFEERLDANSLTIDDVVAVEPRFAELSTIFNDEDLDFIRRLEIRVFDPFDPDFSREVFYLDPVPTNTRKSIRPFPGLSDVKEIVSQTTFGVEIRLAFRRIPSQSYDMRLLFDFSAKGE